MKNISLLNLKGVLIWIAESHLKAHEQTSLSLILIVSVFYFECNYTHSSSGTRFGLTHTYCMVYENATEIEICAGLKPPYGNVACPVDFDFDLQFTIDTETGK